MDFVVVKGYIYFFMMAGAAIMMIWYIWHLYSNRERSSQYEEYSNLVLHDELEDTPVEARENRDKNPKAAKKDER
ncbi:MAG: CcoQ/FixQ family Cbb3-type cytochrome c oxidase assembly chaperone [Campylobacterales bacterium]